LCFSRIIALKNFGNELVAARTYVDEVKEILQSTKKKISKPCEAVV